MAELKPDDSDSSGNHVVRKSVLVCLGERKHPVTFTSNGTLEKRESVLVKTKEAHRDVATVPSTYVDNVVKASISSEWRCHCSCNGDKCNTCNSFNNECS